MILLTAVSLSLGALVSALPVWPDWNSQPVISQPHVWWKEAVVYQVWPASFKESRTDNAIGWGDINGITDNLDHIQSLGVDIVWLSPFYESPLKDMGYDVSDYDSVNPIYGGSMADIENFIAETHKRGMKCIFDLVINHSGDQNEWFLQSKSSRDNYYHDWYFWRDPVYVNGTRTPPNNWSGTNNGSAWAWVPEIGQYYLNLFNYYQPDLNWDNPVTRQGIFQAALNFWLEKGIDGFRLDAFSLYSKPAGLPDVDPCEEEYCNARPLYNNGAHEHEYVHQMNEECLSPYDTFTVGEYGPVMNAKDFQEVQYYTGASRKELSTVFAVNMVDLGRENPGGVYNFSEWRDTINVTQAIGSPLYGEGWNTVFLENHDLARSISRFANDSAEYRVQSGRILSMMLSTLSGTLCIFQMQELGMIDVPAPGQPGAWTIDDYRDHLAISDYETMTSEGQTPEEALTYLQRYGRDNSRTPFNWDSTPTNGNFSVNATTWIRTIHLDINLADQIGDPSSVYEYWIQMIQLRKQYKDLYIYGLFEFLDLESEQFLIYQKTSGATKSVVVLNFRPQEGVPSWIAPASAQLLAGTHGTDGPADSYQPYEGRVYLL